MARKRIGIIIVPPGVFMNIHEKIAVDFLATKIGHDITFLVPDRHGGAKTPDIEMDGLRWEIKSPSGRSSRTIENNLRLALKRIITITRQEKHIDFER